MGIGYVEEILARLQNHALNVPESSTQDNTTLDESKVTFPLNQKLYFDFYFDFSHDTNIAAITTAFGLAQFAPFLPKTGLPANQQLIASHMELFGARLDIEVITAPQPIAAKRTGGKATCMKGGKTTYVHFLLGQSTIPLGRSLKQCGDRDDGWCEYSAFVASQQEILTRAKYDHARNGKYPNANWGEITNGVPLQ
jgi:hypothetical protein